MQCTSHSLLLVIICISCLFAISSAQCRPEIECSARGVCVDSGNNDTWSCICDEGWTTHPVPNSTTIDAVYCNYERKQQLVAFLLSFFVGLFAAGRFYIGQYLTAGLKIGLNIGLGCFGMCCISCVTGVSAFSSGRSNRTPDTCCGKFMAGVGCCYVFLVTLGIFAWLIADWVLFGLNKIPDGNGVDLQPW
mmetsp:Transcript_62473/g.99311  ORF Transcript_62473/g.99311 Transcript_62473/m.99311 type:complete len:191 (+) Transcript_62473:105-677(+)